jgi:hypothetical protein
MRKVELNIGSTNGLILSLQIATLFDFIKQTKFFTFTDVSNFYIYFKYIYNYTKNPTGTVACDIFGMNSFRSALIFSSYNFKWEQELSEDSIGSTIQKIVTRVFY